MSSKAPSTNNLSQTREVVHQLRLEAGIDRIKVSTASTDIMKYCTQHQKADPLIMGIPASENPFKEKKPCTVL